MTTEHHWYVTYTFSSVGVQGHGALTMHTSWRQFPIRQCSDWIQNEIKQDRVIIQTWRRISDAQVEEFKATAERVEVKGD